MSKEIVTDFVVGERLDKVLSTAFEQYSRSALEKLIQESHVTVNGVIKKTKYKLKKDDVIEVDLTMFTSEPESISLPVVFENDDVVVINKPAGVLTHAKGTLHNEATVATWLKSHCGSNGETEFWSSNRAGIVHRLDRVTSGVMICAKNEAAQTKLQKQFSDRKAKKSYLAIIEGSLDEPEGTIDVPIERNPKAPATFRPGINGKSAQTHYTVVSVTSTYTLIEMRPYTGRTHQLRVHMQYMKHPIVGDVLYGGQPADRLMLHAKQLEISIPGGERRTFTTDCPEELTNLVS